jgi:uncharacterized protein YciI
MWARSSTTKRQVINSSLLTNEATQNLFVISLEYKVSIDDVERHLPGHIEFLGRGYEDGVFIASGRKVPRTGGVIIAAADSKVSLEELIRKDPFIVNGVAEYSITEFVPSRYDNSLSSIMETNTSKCKT